MPEEPNNTADTRSLATLAARSGEGDHGLPSRPLVEPIQQATVYAFEDLASLEDALSGASGAPFYYRNGTPNRSTLERTVAALEGTEDAVATSSGMSAILGAFLAVLKPGDRVLTDVRVYGGTYALMTQDLGQFGVHVDWVDVTDVDAVRDALTPETRLLHYESLTNPHVTVPNTPELVRVAHDAGVLVSVDNTFASPALHRPAQYGADLVTHSLAKYLNGHSTGMGGVIAGSRELMAAARTKVVRLGATIGSFDAWMTTQGIKTLGLRMRAHSQNAQAVADVLENHPRVRALHYPGLTSHPQFEFAADLFPEGFGGMMALEVEDADAFVRRLRGRIPLAPSLADVASTMSYPWGTSHRALPEERRLELGITPNLIRLSVGIEDVSDLLDDLEGALGDD